MDIRLTLSLIDLVKDIRKIVDGTNKVVVKETGPEFERTKTIKVVPINELRR